MATKKSQEEIKYKVSGHVFNSNGELITGQEVLGADVDLRGAAIYKTVPSVAQLKANEGFDLLGTATTDDNGYYEILFTAEMYQRNEIGLADVIVFATDGDKITARSRLASEGNYNNNELTNWDIRLADSTKRGLSEYEKLMKVIGPFVKQSVLELYQLGPSADQIAFLATETIQDPEHTRLAVQADVLKNDCVQQNTTVKSTFITKDIEFFSELFYGIGRQAIALDWPSLVTETQNELKTAIDASIAQNIIGPQEDIAVDAFITVAMRVALEKSATAPETAPFYEVIAHSLKDPSLQKTFVQTYMQFNGTPANFWSNLAQQPGFTPELIGSLQLTNQLSILTSQHTALIGELQATRTISDPSDLLSLSTQDWTAIIQKVGVPASVPGATPEEKASNYISGMQNLLNASYPTQRIALMVTGNQVPIKDSSVKTAVSAFFKAAQGFDMGSSRITDPNFDKILKNAAGNQYNLAQQQLLLMQRIFQVSPTPDVMTVLLSKGYTSASHISSVSQNLFISREASSLGGEDVAISVYNRARHQSMRAHHIILKTMDTQDRATPSKIITTQQQQTISNYLANLNSSN
jgi:hypothetical protein